MATPRNQSVFKAFSMLESFKSPEEWVTSSELSRRANLPDASGYRLIQTLEEIGAVVRGPRGRYRPGMLLVSLSNNVAVGELLHQASQAITAELAKLHDVTVHVGILEGGMVTYVTKASTPASFSSHTKLGCQLEAYCSGLGKVLLAGLPKEQLESFLLEGQLVALTPFTITDQTILRAKLDEVRRRGYALDERECRPDMCCVAVAIHDSQGRTVAAMSATESSDRMTPERQQELFRALSEGAVKLEQKVYRTGPKIPFVSSAARRNGVEQELI